MSAFPYRIGHGYDVHALGGGLELWLGGVRIPHVKGCIAHSDGDVAIHALCDAMLGALALGDIGQHFPDTSDEFRGIDSKILLRRVNDLIAAQGYQVANADITIAAQKPRLAPYIAQMRQTMADVLGVDVSQISVKATTTEHLGFTGREEGIAEEICSGRNDQALPPLRGGPLPLEPRAASHFSSLISPPATTPAKRAGCGRCGRPRQHRGHGGWMLRAQVLRSAVPVSGVGLLLG